MLFGVESSTISKPMGTVQNFSQPQLSSAVGGWLFLDFGKNRDRDPVGDACHTCSGRLKAHSVLPANMLPPVEQAIPHQTGAETTRAFYRRGSRHHLRVQNLHAVPKLSHRLCLPAWNVIVLHRTFSERRERFVEDGFASVEVDVPVVAGVEDFPHHASRREEHPEQVPGDVF